MRRIPRLPLVPRARLQQSRNPLLINLNLNSSRLPSTTTTTSSSSVCPATAAGISTSATRSAITDRLREMMYKPVKKEDLLARKKDEIDDGYVPAKDARGLRVVGEWREGWEKARTGGEWVLESFAPANKNSNRRSPRKLARAALRAYIENLAIRLYPHLDVPPASTSGLVAIQSAETSTVPEAEANAEATAKEQEDSDSSDSEVEDNVPEISRQEADELLASEGVKRRVEDGVGEKWVRKVVVKRDPTTGITSFDFVSEDVIRNVLSARGEVVTSEVDLNLGPGEELGKLKPGTEELLNSIRFENAEEKLAVYSRFFSLTGLQISDAALSPASTLADLVNPLLPPPPKRKLHLRDSAPEINSIPNVKVYVNRLNKSAIERARGRLMNRELYEEKKVEREIERREELEKLGISMGSAGGRRGRYRYPFERAVHEGKIKGMQKYLQ